MSFSSYTESAPGSCKLGDVRLVNGSDTSAMEGRVEVCLGDEWATVCDTIWGTPDAQVICRQLGFNASSKSLVINLFTLSFYLLSFNSCLRIERSFLWCWQWNNCSQSSALYGNRGKSV